MVHTIEKLSQLLLENETVIRPNYLAKCLSKSQANSNGFSTDFFSWENKNYTECPAGNLFSCRRIKLHCIVVLLAMVYNSCTKELLLTGPTMIISTITMFAHVTYHAKIEILSHFKIAEETK